MYFLLRNLIDSFRIVCVVVIEYGFLLVYGVCYRINYMVNDKKSLKIYKLEIKLLYLLVVKY